LVTASQAVPAGSTQGVVLAVTDIATIHAELAARGVQFKGGIVETRHGRFASFTDPDGNGWVLREAVTSS
jgi:predicted enzyme related to lactoylglutathione lyase